MSKRSACTVGRGFSALCFCVLLACGGGGGGDDGGGEEPPSLSLFGTSYGYSGFNAYENPAASHRSRWGWLISDRAGGFSCNYTLNDDTHVVTADADHTYEIGAGRSLTFLTGGSPYARGRITEVGHYAALAWDEPGTLPGILLNVRAGTSYTEADLQHVYVGCGIEYLPGAGLVRATVGDYTFNGTGGWTGTYTVNIEGDVYPGQVHGPGAYDILSTGYTTFTYESGFALGGHLGANGDVLSVAGGLQEGDALYLTVFVRGGIGMSAASLSGSWRIVGLSYDFRVSVEDWIGVSGTLTADGSGGYSATLIHNQAGAVSAPYTETGTYTVSGSGGLTLTRADGSVFAGGLSNDRTFAVLGGGTTDLSMPSIYLLVK